MNTAHFNKSFDPSLLPMAAASSCAVALDKRSRYALIHF